MKERKNFVKYVVRTHILFVKNKKINLKKLFVSRFEKVCRKVNIQKIICVVWKLKAKSQN